MDRLEHCVANKQGITVEHFLDYAGALGMDPSAEVASHVVETWNEVCTPDQELCHNACPDLV